MKLSDRLRDEHESGDCGRALDGFAEMAEALEDAKTKIKMTKTLPAEVGQYYWAADSAGGVIVGEIESCGDFYEEGRYMKPSDMGGYWAKVDQSMFEFEDE